MGEDSSLAGTLLANFESRKKFLARSCKESINPHRANIAFKVVQRLRKNVETSRAMKRKGYGANAGAKSPTGSEENDLPAGWTVRRSRNSGKEYYNTVTGEKCWEHPRKPGDRSPDPS